MLLFRSRFPGLSPYFRPGFPCLLSGSVYLAFCQFPFVLPCFAPTAVPQVLAWFRSPFGSLPFSIFPSCLHSFVCFHSGSDYLAPVSSFPFFPFQPHGGLSGACFPHSPQPVSMSWFLLPVLSSPAFPFYAHCFATQVLLQLPASCFQLGRSP